MPDKVLVTREIPEAGLRFLEDFDVSVLAERPPTRDETTLGVVDFSICPHLAADGMPGNSMAEAEQWAAGIPNAAYAMDDQTAITVVDGEVHFVSEGHWEQLRTLSSEPNQA